MKYVFRPAILKASSLFSPNAGSTSNSPCRKLKVFSEMCTRLVGKSFKTKKKVMSIKIRSKHQRAMVDSGPKVIEPSKLTQPFRLTPSCLPVQHPLNTRRTATDVARESRLKLRPCGCRLACLQGNWFSAERICKDVRGTLLITVESCGLCSVVNSF